MNLGNEQRYKWGPKNKKSGEENIPEIYLEKLQGKIHI